MSKWSDNSDYFFLHVIWSLLIQVEKESHTSNVSKTGRLALFWLICCLNESPWNWAKHPAPHHLVQVDVLRSISLVLKMVWWLKRLTPNVDTRVQISAGRGLKTIWETFGLNMSGVCSGSCKFRQFWSNMLKVVDPLLISIATTNLNLLCVPLNLLQCTSGEPYASGCQTLSVKQTLEKQYNNDGWCFWCLIS